MEFCNQIGIDAREVLQTMGIEWRCFDIQRYLDSVVESDPEDIERFKAMFLEHWPF